MITNIKEEPYLFVLFGATGDLTSRKIIPALYNLFLDNWLPNEFVIIGCSYSEVEVEVFRKNLLEGINQNSRKGKADAKQWKEFSAKIVYQQLDFNNAASFKPLKAIIDKYHKGWKKEAQIIYYLAVAPKFFGLIADNIAKNNLIGNCENTRFVVEKPFGHDLESAKELNAKLCSIFDERQIYRIDHYLGKEAVQNIMAFRFANSILEPIWSRNYIEHVQISVLEELGVEKRGGYYEGAGAMRDMIQNHLLQLLCLTAMETPINFTADEVRNRKVDVLKAMRRFSSEEIRMHAVRGQYGGGWMEGTEVPGYRQEPDVNPKSNTETFAAIKFFVDNWRWEGVPFYMRTGKRMHETCSTISIQFRDVPHVVFPSEATNNWQQNRLIISIQPEMSIRLQLQTKRPGLDMVLNTVDMVFNYKDATVTESPEAYETLLLDIMQSDQTLFMRADQVEEAWALLMPILDSWQTKESVNFPNYAAGSNGPEIAEALIARDGFHWFSLPLKK